MPIENTSANKADRRLPELSGPDHTVGIIIGKFNDQYEALMWSGVSESIRQHQVNSIAYVTTPLTNIASSRTFEMFDKHLINLDRLDVMLMYTGSLIFWLGFDEVDRLAKKYAQLMPLYGMCVPVQDGKAIVVDNYNGMFQLVEHLIVEHGYQQIAFVAGPKDHPEAAARLSAYRDALSKHDMPIQEHLIYYGDLYISGATDAAKYFFDGSEDFSIEAIVSANDTMAKTMIDELVQRGYGVPADIAVTGFDDISDAQYYSPPLTTVHQPIHEQGSRAVNHILQVLNTNEELTDIELATTPVIRASCGCDYANQAIDPKKDAWVLGTLRSVDKLDRHNRLFMQSRSWDELANAVHQGRIELGLSCCYVCRFEDSAEPEYARLLCGSDNDGRILVNEDAEPFLAKQLLPHDIWAKHPKFNFVVEVLHFEEELLGFLVIDDSLNEAWIYESIRTHISVTLKNIALLEQEKQYTANLEKQVALRKNELEEVLQERAEWLRVATHDLRNPLSAVLLTVSTLRRAVSKLTEQQVDHRLVRIADATKRMQRIIDRLLTVGQLDDGQLETEHRQVDIASLLEDLLGGLRPLAAKKRIAINYQQRRKIEGKLDAALFEKIVTTLVSNAIKYSPVDTEITIEIEPTVDGFELRISDQGLGFTENDMERVFTKYGRLSAQPTGNEESIGLGLFIVNKLVESMNGTIALHSDGHDLGSTFIVELPFD